MIHLLFATLVFSFASNQVLKVGDTVPKVNIRTTDGKTHDFRDFLKTKPTVLIFYRGGWCPYCNLHLKDLKKIGDDVKKRGYRIVAISPDRPEELKKSIEKNKITYTLLSDSKSQAADAFGLSFEVDKGTLDKYKGYGIDLEKSSGEKHHKLPHPAVFVVDRDLKIKFSHHDPNYKVRLKNEDILKAL